MTGMDRHEGEHARLGVFETFRTKSGVLTGLAQRQRTILGVLAGSGAPEKRTRIAISQHVASGDGARWKNVYSGVFHDISDVLIPLGLVEEAGRIPPRRGSKALQEAGIPYYHLTREGSFVALAFATEKLGEQIGKVFAESKGEEARIGTGLALLAGFAPGLASSIVSSYVRAYCDGHVRKLLPLSVEKLRSMNDDSVSANLEFLSGALELDRADQERVKTLLGAISAVS